MKMPYNRKMEWLFKLSERALMQKLEEKFKTKAIKQPEFLYIKGTIPVMLIAHLDTAHYTFPENIYFDERAQVLWSPSGLGADDRAGILGILWLLEAGYSPHVVFTCGEEKGGIGAKALVDKYKCPDIKFIIELDRKNGQEAVFYNCNNEEFKKFIYDFGYKEGQGTFTDISIICPKWDIAGVNLSCGYYEEHTPIEYLKLNELRKSIKRVATILNTIPERRFEYKSKERTIRKEVRKSASPLPSYIFPSYFGSEKEENIYLDIEIPVVDLEWFVGKNNWIGWVESHYEEIKEIAVAAIMERIDQLYKEESVYE